MRIRNGVVIWMSVTSVLLSTGCRGRASSLNREQKRYDVVQEGSTSGSTTAVVAPGESAPVAMTNTNADTTSNFIIGSPAGAASSTQPPGTLAGTLSSAGMDPGNPRPAGVGRRAASPARTVTRKSSGEPPPANPPVVPFSDPATTDPSAPPPSPSSATSTGGYVPPATSTERTAPPIERSRENERPVPRPPSDPAPATQTGTIGPG